MSDTKFTKGEWSTDDMGIVESGNRIVCDTYMTCKEDLANANLIKTSPKMYREIERGVDWLSRMIVTHGVDHPMTPMFADMKKDKMMLLAEAKGEL